MTRPSSASAAPQAPAAPRLALNQLRRMRRIVDAAVSLAEEGGFEAVRLRDVAERSEVALGTLYKYFRGKEDLLLFALNEQFDRLEAGLVGQPARGGTPLLRVTDLFRRATAGITAKPQFAQAVVRALGVGDPETALKIAAFQMQGTRLITSALHGEGPDPTREPGADVDEREHSIAFMLLQVWHSSLVGWAAGLHDDDTITTQVGTAARLVLEPES